jgi:hypothetical protein
VQAAQLTCGVPKLWPSSSNGLVCGRSRIFGTDTLLVVVGGWSRGRVGFSPTAAAINLAHTTGLRDASRFVRGRLYWKFSRGRVSPSRAVAAARAAPAEAPISPYTLATFLSTV